MMRLLPENRFFENLPTSFTLNKRAELISQAGQRLMVQVEAMRFPIEVPALEKGLKIETGSVLYLHTITTEFLRRLLPVYELTLEEVENQEELFQLEHWMVHIPNAVEQVVYGLLARRSAH